MRKDAVQLNKKRCVFRLRKGLDLSLSEDGGDITE